MTETDELAAALDAAARRWPSLSRSQLVVRLALEGHRAALHEHADVLRRRRSALQRVSGTLTGAYPDSYLDDLRADWPR